MAILRSFLSFASRFISESFSVPIVSNAESSSANIVLLAEANCRTTTLPQSFSPVVFDCLPPRVSNSSNPLERFQVRVGTRTEPCQRFYKMKNLDRWHLGRFPPQTPAFASPDVSLQLSIWVLIVSWHDVYADCAVLASLSPPAFRFAIRPIFVESLSKTREFRW